MNFFLLCLTLLVSATRAQVTTSAPTQDQSSIMNIWNYQIQRTIKTSVAYKIWDLAVWEELTANTTAPGDRRYYVTPPITFISGSAQCKYVPVMKAYSVVYDVQLWEHELPKVVVAKLQEMGLTIREDQVHPLPFYQARIVWNNPEQQLQDLTISAAWVNNLQQQYQYSFHVAAANNVSCQLLADTLRTSPNDIINFLQLQFTVSAAKIESKSLEVKSEHIIQSQLASSLKNLPGAEGEFRFLNSDDYNRMLLQISNKVVASEVTSGDYVDADDELSLKDTVSSMLKAQQVDVGGFDDRMWNSTFWDPLDERPDRVTKEMNKYFKLNQTDGRWYLTQSSASSSSSNVNGLIKDIVNIGGGHSSSSSSSMTNDQMIHLLEQYDIESEIDGDKFIPKKLDLMRLNVNSLTSGDQVLEKVVRIKQVDIGGVLQLAVGNNSIGQIEDENRYLRQQINDMQQQLAAATTRMNSMETTINQKIDAVSAQEQSNQAALNQKIDGVDGRQQAAVTNAVNGVINRMRAVSSNPNAVCSGSSTPDHSPANYLFQLGDHDVRCPDGQVLTRWHFSGGHVDFTCCSLA